MLDNTSKIIWYLRLIAKKPIQIDGREEFKNIKKIKLSPSIFNTDSCEVCGDCCCVHEDNVYTQHEYDKIMSMTEEQFRAEGYIFSKEGFDPSFFVRLKNKIEVEKHIINGKEIPFYIAKVENVKLTRIHNKPGNEDKEYLRCTWTYRDTDGLTKCAIHPVRSITCDMPHVRFIYQKGKTLSIAITQYGRNWAMLCPVQFQEPKDEAEWQRNKDNVLRKLIHLNKTAVDLNVETYLPEVIEYLKNIPYNDYKSYLGKDIVNVDTVNGMNTKKLFSD